MIKYSVLFFLLFFITIGLTKSASQNIIENYHPKKNDSIKVGYGDKDYFQLVQKGYTLMLPENTPIKGTLIFLEDSKYDTKNRSAKQLYNRASENGFAVLSVSTEIPLDFYFTQTSLISAHNQIKNVFAQHKLPNKNIFFLGASLVGHRAMKYIEFVAKNNYQFQQCIVGVVVCNFTMDWTRKWKQHKRDIKINRIDLWEPKFINYMLESHLGGTPETAAEKYHEFSTYSYFDEKNRNIAVYKNFAVRAYVDPAIEYKLTNQLRTMYENNTTDVLGFLAELELIGNKNTELVVLQPEDNKATSKNSQSTWDAIDKNELMNWILGQSN